MTVSHQPTVITASTPSFRLSLNSNLTIAALRHSGYNSPHMLVKLKTFSLLGIDAVPVEVDCANIGMPKTNLVGLPDAAVTAQRQFSS